MLGGRWKTHRGSPGKRKGKDGVSKDRGEVESLAARNRLPKIPRSGSCLFDPNPIPCYKDLLSHFFIDDLSDISCCCHSMKCGSVEINGGIPEKYIDSDIIGRSGILKNALLLLIPIS